MKIKSLMTQGVECIGPQTTVQEAAARMSDMNVGVLPICGDQNKLVGMITDRDIVVRAIAAKEDPQQLRVDAIMSPSISYCYEEQDIEEAARIMQDNQVRRLVVLNDDKQLVGIVSTGDLAVGAGDDRLCGETLQEISEPVSPA